MLYFTTEVLKTDEIVHSMKELVIPAINALHADVMRGSTDDTEYLRGIDTRDRLETIN